MGAPAVVAGVFPQLEELLDVEVPGFEVAAHRALALAAVVREAGGRHVRLVALDLQVIDEGLGRDVLHFGHAREELAFDLEPVALGDQLAPHQRGDFRHRRDAQVIGARLSVEARGGTVGARCIVAVHALAILARRRNAHAQKLVAQCVDQGLRGVGEIDLLAARDASVGLEQSPDEGRGVRFRQVREAPGDSLAASLVVDVFVSEGHRGFARAHDAPGGGIAHYAATERPMDLGVGLAPPRFPEMNAARLEVAAHEGEMFVLARIARNAPLHRVLRKVPVAQQDSVQARVVLGKAGDVNHFRGNDLRHVVAAAQLAGLDPLRFHFALRKPLECAPVRLLHRHAANSVEGMSRGDQQRADRVLHLHRDHALRLVVGEAALDFAIRARLAEHEIATLHILDLLQSVRGVDARIRREALVHRHRGIGYNLQEGDHTLRLAIGPLDVGAQRAHRRPVVAQAPGELGEQRVLLDRLVDAIEIVGDRGEVARGELRAQRPGIEERGRGRHEVEGGQHVVELDRAVLAVDLVQRESHRHAHEESLRQLDAPLVHVQEVAVVERLQAEIVELQVALGFQRRAQALEVIRGQPLVEQLRLHAAADEAREVLGVARGHLRVQHFLAQHLAADRVQQQARGHIAVVGIALDQHARGEDRALVHFLERHAVVEVAQRGIQDQLGLDVGAQVLARARDEGLELRGIERLLGASHQHVDARLARLGGLLHALGAFAGTLLAIQHVGARDLVLARAHHRELDLVLHVLDVERAARGVPPHERGDHRLRERGHLVAHARARRGGVARDREERLGHRHRDLVGLEAHDRAIAPDDLVVRVSLLRRRAFLPGIGVGEGGRGMDIGSQAHGSLLMLF